MLKRIRRISGLIAMVCLFAHLCLFGTAYADVRFQSQRDENLGVVFGAVFSGKITERDLSAFLALESEILSANNRIAILNSDGGDVDAAMAIGRYLRKWEFTAAMPRGTKCLSACVFLLAAGLEKKVYGTVGIHRPYFPTPPSVPASETIINIKNISEKYFSEMNIPARLAEDMFSIEPSDMKILSDNELRSYRLNLTDFAYEEGEAVKTMRDLGIDREVYEAFRADMNYSCQIFMSQPQRLRECLNEVSRKHGIPEVFQK